MEKTNKIYIKLELEKNNSTNELLLTMTFDKNAPNFFTDNNMIRWRPTSKEIEFFNEAFTMFSPHEHWTHSEDNEEESVSHTEHDTGDTVLLEEQDVVDKVIKRKKQ